MKLKLVVLISGYGSNLQALINAIDNGFLQAEILLVISNKPNAFGLERAKAKGIMTQIIESPAVLPLHMDHPDYDQQLINAIQPLKPDYIILAGFMKILGTRFLSIFENQVLNIHPSLLPHYKGLKTHARVLKDGMKQHGCSVHIVTPELDSGPILGQATLDVLPTDTEESLKARVQKLEHQLYPEVIQTLWRARYEK